MFGWEYKLVVPMKIRVRIGVMQREFNRVGEEGPDDDRTADRTADSR
jgi:hypothetical protein